MRRIAPCGDKQLEDVVERRGIGLAAVDDGQELFQLVTENVGRQRRLARGERVQVALDRVDLSVVREGAERMRQLPRREGVRRIALVHDRERRDEIRLGEVGIELLDLRREKQPLVDDRPRRAGADIGVLRRLLDLPADDIEAALKVFFDRINRIYSIGRFG